MKAQKRQHGNNKRVRAAAQFMEWRNTGHPMRVSGDVAAALTGDASLAGTDEYNLSSLALRYTK